MSDATAQQKIRGAYGRGYHDAMKAMEKQDHMTTPAKIAKAEQAVNGIALKVLEATPMQEAWTLARILGELKRTGRNISTDVALGCLLTMARTGLVKEVEPRTFQRVTAKPRTPLAVVESAPEVKAQAPAPAPAVAPPRPKERDTLTKLADLSAGVRAMAQQFTDLAVAIDDVALEVEDRIAGHAEDSQKLNQLRALLKGIGA